MSLSTLCIISESNILVEFQSINSTTTLILKSNLCMSICIPSSLCSMNSKTTIHFSFIALLIWFQFASANMDQDTLAHGSQLFVDQNPARILFSRNAIFSAGFYPVGVNAYGFAIWFNDPSCPTNCTLVWMANRDAPVNGKRSKLSLRDKSGNLVLTDADRSVVWSTNLPPSSSSPSLQLLDTGNLVLVTTVGVVIWQSFDSPTDTLLPGQPLTRNTQLVSSISRTNFSSGFYKLSFDDSNVLRLLYDGPEVSSVYWPDPWLLSRENGRNPYNDSRIAVLDSLGNFTSSDELYIQAADHGEALQRRLTLDVDGNPRQYSRRNRTDSWAVSWRGISQPCKIHATCGPNSVCSYDHSFGRSCSCLPGFKMKDPVDWSAGCELISKLSCDRNQSTFDLLTRVEMFGYDVAVYENYTLEMCKEECLKSCACRGFVLKFIIQNRPDNVPYCVPKTKLRNGFRSPNFRGDLYLRVPKTTRMSNNLLQVKEIGKDCPAGAVKELDKKYAKSNGNWSLTFVLWFSVALGSAQIFCIALVFLFLNKTRPTTQSGYALAGIGFQRFSYSELKKATGNFREEIGRGASGIVYKGKLKDNRVAAIKKLYHEAKDGEAEFLAEVRTIGNLNHMNLIEMWGYCAEGNQRLLVFEFMDNGPLDRNLSDKKLDWKKRFEIALGTARGLAYLHEECLEWILHCDVKPGNILLDSNHNPRVSDFGLSRLLSRRQVSGDASFSKIRGTRGYMAPEWLLKLPITSKVDVYSYGIVVLELVTGKNPAMESIGVDTREHGVRDCRTLVDWMRKKRVSGGEMESFWVEEVIDSEMGSEYDRKEIEIVVDVALKCVEHDRDSRPTMRQVVQMLVSHEHD